MYFVALLHGQATSGSPGGQRGADGVRARHEVAGGAELLEHALAHAGHDAHR